MNPIPPVSTHTETNNAKSTSGTLKSSFSTIVTKHTGSSKKHTSPIDGRTAFSLGAVFAHAAYPNRRSSRKIQNDVTAYNTAVDSGNNVNLASGNKNQIATASKTRTMACTVNIDVS